MKTKKIWTPPHTEIERFTPNESVGVCSWSGIFHCQIPEGSYANGTQTIDGTVYHRGAKDGLAHGNACTTTTMTDFKKTSETTGTGTGYETNKQTSPFDGVATFASDWDWKSVGTDHYVMWTTRDGSSSGTQYIHEGYVQSWTKNLS